MSKRSPERWNNRQGIQERADGVHQCGETEEQALLEMGLTADWREIVKDLQAQDKGFRLYLVAN